MQTNSIKFEYMCKRKTHLADMFSVLHYEDSDLGTI